MDDYISREAALKVFCDWCCVCPKEKRKPLECDDILGNVLRNLPAADVQPVRHGRWVTREVLVNPIDGIWRTLVECSECGGEAFKHEVYGYQRDNFCHLCGADMREEAQ